MPIALLIELFMLQFAAVALAREITADPLFAIASVNYIWKEFFGRGIINPVDQIDPARLDPNNLPSDCADPAPCGVQPSNPALLKALRDKLAANRATCPLFDTALLCRRLEAAYDTTWEIATAGERPRHFVVPE